MRQVQQRIDSMGGSGFIRDCAHWAADQIAHLLLPYLVTALRKDLIPTLHVGTAVKIQEAACLSPLINHPEGQDDALFFHLSDTY